jgi:hypothetical protein
MLKQTVRELEKNSSEKDIPEISRFFVTSPTNKSDGPFRICYCPTISEQKKTVGHASVTRKRLCHFGNTGKSRYPPQKTRCAHFHLHKQAKALVKSCAGLAGGPVKTGSEKNMLNSSASSEKTLHKSEKRSPTDAILSSR